MPSPLLGNLPGLGIEPASPASLLHCRWILYLGATGEAPESTSSFLNPGVPLGLPGGWKGGSDAVQLPRQAHQGNMLTTGHSLSWTTCRGHADCPWKKPSHPADVTCTNQVERPPRHRDGQAVPVLDIRGPGGASDRLSGDYSSHLWLHGGP